MSKSDEILEILMENPNLSNREIGKLVKLSRGGVQHYMNKLGIHRDRKLMQRLNNTKREKALDITKTAEQIILGSILGDGCIIPYRRPENTKLLLNSYLAITHGVKQYGYILHKRDLLEKEGVRCHLLERKPPKKKHYIKGIEVKENGGFSLKTIRNVSFNRYRDMFYNGRKYINRYVYKLDPLGLAIWYMDDGNYYMNKKGNVQITLYTNCFSIKDDNLLVKMLKHNFDIDTSLHKTANIGRCIYIKSVSRNRFLDLVRPYICDCMKYKIGT